jgi:hypothetical protein
LRAWCLGILPPVLVTAAYLAAWHGLVPPELASAYRSGPIIETGPLAQAIALLGVLAVPYGFLVLRRLGALGARRLIAIALVASAAAIAFWLVVPTTRDLDAGRAGSFFWLLAGASPAIGDRAVFTLPLLALGFAAIGSMVELARAGRYTPIETIMLGLYVAGLAIQPLSYQRYSEVATLIALSTTAARNGPTSRWGALSFAAAYTAKFFVTLLMSKPG